MTTSKQIVYVGTYTENWGNPAPRDESIFVYEFDAASGSLRFLRTISGIRNPSFLTLTADTIFTVNELGKFMGADGGGATSINRSTEQIINAQPTHGADTCNIIVDPTGKYVLTANYTSGSATVFPIQADGSLGEATQVMQNHGHGTDPVRQDAPHIHCVASDPAGKFAFITDLGLDKIFIFRLDTANGQLTPNDPPFAEAVPGAGPRHLQFHPNGKFLYATNELNWTVAVYAYDAEHGALTPMQTISTVPDGFSGTNLTADIHILSSGKFLYASNRGHDSIAVYAVDVVSGRLTLVDIASAGGKTPRNFALDLTERYVLVAHQNSASLTVFPIDGQTGKLGSAGQSVSLPYPVCVRVVEGM